MAVKQRKPVKVRGSEMSKLGRHLQDQLRQLRKQLAEAEWLIKELDMHEGAEGWSEYLRKRLDAYEYKTKGTRQ